MQEIQKPVVLFVKLKGYSYVLLKIEITDNLKEVIFSIKTLLLFPNKIYWEVSGIF
jgi:hypothetical protein